MSAGPGARRTHDGVLPSGSPYRVEVPERWNGVLLLTCRPLPFDPGDPPWELEEEPLLRALLEAGYALAGSTNTIFWPLEHFFDDQLPLLERAVAVAGTPRQVIAWGLSIGGIMTAGLVQLFPEHLAGALPVAGNLSGAVAVHNRELDIAFVVQRLLAAGRPLELSPIASPAANVALAKSILGEASSNPAGRARLSLAAAVGDLPGWHEGPQPPARNDHAARLDAQIAWFEEIGFEVYFGLRAQVDRQAGGRPSWNSGIDYADLLARSTCREEVEACYGAAGLDLDADLAELDAAPRLEADGPAVEYLERHIVFDGDLHGVPVLSVHDAGDGLVPTANERAYEDVVEWAGQSELFRPLFLWRGGHIAVRPAELLAALSALEERIERGAWPDLSPEAMNDLATAIAGRTAARSPAQAAPATFARYEAPMPLRRYDARDAAARREQ